MMGGGQYVVTGASGGIGGAVARMLLSRGESVVAVSRSASRLASLLKDFPGAIAVEADLALPSALDTVSSAVPPGGVRGFAHCAGFDSPAPLPFVREADALSLYSVHALFPMRFMGWMAKGANHAPGASCVIVSSIACRSGAKGYSAYAAAKGAAEGMLKAVAAELAPRGIRVNAVAPGIVETAMTRPWIEGSPPETVEAVRALYPLGFGAPEDVASVVDFLLGPQSKWITGQCIVADGGRSLA